MCNFDLTKLNDKQLKATKQVEGAVLVTAGAGSGKTRVLTHRIAHLIEEGYAKPYEILAITFTNKAAAEMRDRLNEMIIGASDVWMLTFHSMCVKLLRQNKNIERFSGYTTNFSIYDTKDRERILKQLVAVLEIEDEDFVKKVDWHISNCKNKNMTLEQYANEISYYKEVKNLLAVMEQYEQKMNANNALDFDSLLTYTYKLLSQNPDILEYYQNKFKYIHIDEFQDTNKVQYDIAKALAGKYKNIFVVGDEDQCIYTWRGANSSHIFEFTNDFENVTTIKLEQNYRSTKKIIEAANKIIKHNTSRLDKKLWTDKEDGVRIEFSNPYNENYEAEYVAENIFNLVRNSGYDYSDVAVLMRLNALTRSVEEKLLNYNIPYRVFGGMKFYDRVEIKNILAYLKLIVNPKDGGSFNRVINFPKRGLGNAALMGLKATMSELQSPLEAILNLNESSALSNSALTKFLNFKTLMQGLIKQKENFGLYDFIEYVIDASGIKESYSSGKEEDVSRLYNISEFLGSVKEYESGKTNVSLEEYLQTISLTTDMDTYDQKEKSVTLATVHGVKGLEFKVVFVIGLEEKIFPLKRKDSTDKDLEEERRLMYVAITRAEERLYLSYSQSRFIYGQRNYSQPSQFLKDLDLIKEKETENSKVVSISSLNTVSTIQTLSGALQNKNQTSATQNNTPEKLKTIKEGNKVSHPKFGVGFVLAITGSSNNKTVKINFENFGTKILALQFAPLTIL